MEVKEGDLIQMKFCEALLLDGFGLFRNGTRGLAYFGTANLLYERGCGCPATL